MGAGNQTGSWYQSFTMLKREEIMDQISLIIQYFIKNSGKMYLLKLYELVSVTDINL